MTQDQDTGTYYGPFAPPRKPEVGAPGGHGEAHAPGGGYSVEAQDLVNAASAWDDVSTALSKAWSLAQEGWGYPGLFGMHDTLFTAGRLHMLANQVVVNACGDGAGITALLADGLTETANDYSGTDASQGTPFRTLERRAGE